jgi:hypothetical protein
MQILVTRHMKAMGPDNAIISDCSNQQAWFIHKAAIRAIFQPESAIFITSISFRLVFEQKPK